MIRNHKVTRTNSKEHIRGRKKSSVRFMAAFMAAILTLSIPATALPAGAADGSMQEAASSEGQTASENKSVPSKNQSAEAQTSSSEEQSASSRNQDSANAANASDTASTSELIGEQDNYQVTLSYDKTSVTNIPDDAHLKITPLKTTDDAYQTAREAVIREKKSEDSSFNEDTLGMDAVDISILNADESKEIEPNGKVDVQIQLKQLPDGVDSNTDLEVQHILDTGIDTVNENSVSTLSAPTRHLVRRSPSANPGAAAANSEGQTVQTVLTGVKAGQVLQFSVDSFSIFTITWMTKSGDNDVRFANVKVHYVDENGLELTDPSTVPASELNDGTDTDTSKNNNIVDLSKWAYTTDDNGTTTSRVSGYTFQKATIGTLKGTEVTGLKGSKDIDDNNTTYRLYYTTTTPVSSDSEWTQYKDPTSGTASNNADVYLIYKTAEKRPVTIHFLSLDGTAIKDSNGSEITTIIDAVDHTSSLDLVGWANNHVPTGYSIKQMSTGGINNPTTGNSSQIFVGDSNGNEVVGIKGIKFRFLKYDASKDEIQRGAYSGNNINWTKISTSDPQIYITLQQADNLKVTIHHVDSDGNKLISDTSVTVPNGGTLTANSIKTDISGYSISKAYFGGMTSGTAKTEISTLTYNKGTQQWTSKNGEVDTDNLVTEVWAVYTKTGGLTKTFTAHYVYLDDNGNVQKTDTSDVSFVIGTDTANKTGNGLGQGGNPQYALMGNGQNTAENKDFFGTVSEPKEVKSADGQKSLSYVTTRMGSETGPELSWIKLDSSGQVLYLTGSSLTDQENASTTYQLTRQGGRNIWTYASNSRTFTLTEDSTGNFKLNDSLTGNVDLNLTESGGTTPRYTATYREADQVTQFAVTLNADVGANASTNYTLTVEDWIPSNSTNLYFIYRDLSKEIYIDNDLIYSGRLKVAYSDDVRKKMEQTAGTDGAVKNATYTWYKITTDDTTQNASSLTDEEKNSGTEVLRTESGTEWNMAYQQSGRTWLNVAVDKGQRTTGQKVFYRVKMEYDNGTEGAKRQTLWTEPVEIGYYGELENGSFETPDKENKDTPATRDGDYSNADYKKYGGVWQTTGLGSNNSKGNQNNKDIEIVDTRPISKDRNEPEYLSPYAFPYDSVEGAADGNQFAELNAEEAGALYQDVITLNNENLNYWLSHRARGQEGRPNKNTYHYDTMYLVIMPTKIAMTSGADGGELASQQDLEAFLRNHGGYEESGNGNSRTSEEETVTYPEDESGIYVVRITSDNMDWHSVRAVDAYIARSNVTRFFFVAGATAYTGNQDSTRNKTIGNLIDAVGFSQGLPAPTGFNLTITKTFSGLTSAQIASMASNASDVTGANLSDGRTNSFTITLDNKHVNLSENKEDEDNSSTPANSALKGAKLSFTASGSGGSYSFTPTAADPEGNSLFSGQSSGTSRVNADGSVTMTWTFADQIVDGTGADQTFNYTASESGELINGFTINSSKAVTPQSYINKEAVEIRRGTSGAINFTNTYSRHRDSDQPEITVRKTFSGVTKATVDKLWSNGYHITVKTHLSNSADDVTATLSKYSDQNSAGVTLVSEQENEDDGSITYVWVISGEKWGPGKFTVTESGVKTGDNQLKKVTMAAFGETSDGSAINVEPDANNTASRESITVSNTAAAALDFAENGMSGQPVSITPDQGNSTTTKTVAEGTNLIIAQFKVGDSSSSNYLVWTSSPLGHATSNAIINQIKQVFNDTSDQLNDQVFFRSGSNPGAITAHGAQMSYDSGSRTLTFTNTAKSEAGGETTSEARTWTRFYSTHYSVAGSSPETYDDQDIKITNIYSPVIKIKKVSADDNTSLKGAVFRLYMKDSNGQKQYYLSSSTSENAKFGIIAGNINENATSERNSSETTDASAENTGDESAGTNSNKALSFTTDSSGQIVIGALPVEANESSARIYYLEEVKAPDGYNRTIDIPFVVHANGTVQLVEITTADNGQTTTNYVTSTSNAEVSREDSYYAITVKDKAGYRLPSTGGPGRNILFWLLGFAITAAAVIYLNRKGYFDPIKKSLRMGLRKRGGQKI